MESLRLERQTGIPNDSTAADVCELVNLLCALRDEITRCRHLELALAEKDCEHKTTLRMAMGCIRACAHWTTRVRELVSARLTERRRTTPTRSAAEARPADLVTTDRPSTRRGRNHCAWLKVGETQRCGKGSRGVHCKIHLAKIRRGSRIPLPCSSCGKGVQSSIRRCRACGRDAVRLRQIALEKRAKRQFSFVMAELLVVRPPN